MKNLFVVIVIKQLAMQKKICDYDRLYKVLTIGFLVLIAMLVYSLIQLRENFTTCPTNYSVTMEDGSKYDTFMPSLSDSKVSSDGTLTCRYGKDCKKRNMLFCGNPFTSKTTCTGVSTVVFQKDDESHVLDALIADDTCKRNVGWVVAEND